MKDSKRDHLYYIDVLRVVSVVAVILAHAHLEYVYYMYWSVLIFTSISGAMMLGRENIDIRRLYTHNICRIATAYVFWSAVYSLLQNLLLPLLDGNKVSIKLIITSFVEGRYHLWYCYMIIGLFILAPCFKAVIDKDKRLGLYYCLIAFAFSVIIPSFQNIDILKWTATPTGNIGLGGLRYSLYFVLGYYLVTYDFTPFFRNIIYISGVVFLIPFIAFPNTAFFNIYEAVVMIAIFIAARYLINLKSGRLKKVISTLADSVFVVYLIHDIFNIIYGRIFGSEHSPVYDLGKFCFTLILSFTAGLLIRKCKRVSSYIS